MVSSQASFLCLESDSTPRDAAPRRAKRRAHEHREVTMATKSRTFPRLNGAIVLYSTKILARRAEVDDKRVAGRWRVGAGSGSSCDGTSEGEERDEADHLRLR